MDVITGLIAYKLCCTHHELEANYRPLFCRCSKLWGISEVERATGKSSACDGFGQKFVSDIAKLAIYE